jgi:hypothetical protein
MTGKAIDINQSLAAWWLRSLRLSVHCWRGAGQQKALQLRQDELKTQIVAAQAANWHEAPRGARNGAAMAVQYGGRYGERATQKQSREEEAEG